MLLTLTNGELMNVNKMCYIVGLGGISRSDRFYADYISKIIIANEHKYFRPVYFS